MAAITFPSSPAVNDVHTANGKSWVWDGTSWNPMGSLPSIVSDVTLAAESVAIANIVKIAQADYDAITTPDPNTWHIIPV